MSSVEYIYTLYFKLLPFYELSLLCKLTSSQRRVEKTSTSELIGFSSSAIEVLKHAELSADKMGNSSVIHMDVDQSFLPMPTFVKAAIFESFARQNITESETEVASSISKYVASNYGFITGANTEFVYANSPIALFNKLVLCCIQEGGTLCFPAGSNGNYVSAAKFLKANIVNIQTSPETGFKLSSKALGDALKTVKKPWVYISGPTVNPTGLLYSNEELKDILSTCAEFGARVVVDTSFSDLIYNSKGWSGWDLKKILADLTSSAKPSFSISLLGGMFLKVLTGGLNFGFLLLSQPSLIDAFHSFSGLSKPHCTTRYAVKKLLDLREQKSEIESSIVAEQEKIFQVRYKRLKEVINHLFLLLCKYAQRFTEPLFCDFHCRLWKTVVGRFL